MEKWCDFMGCSIEVMGEYKRRGEVCTVRKRAVSCCNRSVRGGGVDLHADVTRDHRCRDIDELMREIRA